MIPEIHTSDLTANCLRSVELRILGKRETSMTSALYLGQLFHAAVRNWHEYKAETFDGCTLLAQTSVDSGASDEGRPLTPAVQADRGDHAATVSKWLARYAQVFETYFPLQFPDGHTVYCEVPIRLTLEIDGIDQEFASHLDALILSPDGSVTVLDWKTGQDAPTHSYLSRHLQLGLYWLAVKYGRIMIGGEWRKMEREPRIYWVHVRNLSPYARAGTYKEGDTEISYGKGDFRPNHKIFQGVEINSETAIMNELVLRTRMIRAGMFPTNPDPIGCHLCESNKYCQTFTRENNETV